MSGRRALWQALPLRRRGAAASSAPLDSPVQWTLTRRTSSSTHPSPTQVPPRLPDTEERTAALEAALEERILVLDGATGTALQAVNLTADDFGGPDLEGCNEILCATRPDVVAARPRALPRRRRRHRRDQLLRRHPAGPRRVRPRRPRLRAQRARGAHRARGLRPLRHPGPAALRLRLDGADHQGDLGHRRRHLRGAARRTSACRRSA